jgi:adenylate cyclase
MGLRELKQELDDEVSTILSSDFAIEVTETQSVPHSSDGAITFPNLDERSQGTKLIETTVLYVDMRRSTQLNFQHRRHTVAKLYSAFVRAMTRCAVEFRGEIRGIIGDRLMVLFEPEHCFENAIDAAELMNSVCQHVINKYFTHGEVEFGIGIDHGRMLATKTGIRKHGQAQQSYRSLVWLGRPANVASKLTDNAHKPEQSVVLELVNVAYNNGGQLHYQVEAPHLFVKNFTRNALSGLMVHHNPAFHSFYPITQNHVLRKASPSILMTSAVYDGFRRARPDAIELRNGWFYQVELDIPEYSGQVYGGDVYYIVFKE